MGSAAWFQNMSTDHQPRDFSKSAEVEKAVEAHPPGELDLQAIVQAGLGLPGYEKSTCAWDVQLRRNVAELLSLHQLGGYAPPNRKQVKKKEPRAPSATDSSDD